MEVEEDRSVPTLFLLDDSTSTVQAEEPFRTWGQLLTRFFNAEIAVANHGESGESLHSFIAEGRLAKVMSLIRPGDFLMVQMGHNDKKKRRGCRRLRRLQELSRADHRADESTAQPPY